MSAYLKYTHERSLAFGESFFRYLSFGVFPFSYQFGVAPGTVLVATDISRHFRQGTHKLRQCLGMVCYRLNLFSENSDGEDDHVALR